MKYWLYTYIIIGIVLALVLIWDEVRTKGYLTGLDILQSLVIGVGWLPLVIIMLFVDGSPVRDFIDYLHRKLRNTVVYRTKAQKLKEILFKKDNK